MAHVHVFSVWMVRESHKVIAGSFASLRDVGHCSGVLKFRDGIGLFSVFGGPLHIYVVVIVLVVVVVSVSLAVLSGF